MTFLEAQNRLDKSVQRSDLAPRYPDFINEAIREIENQRSWTFQKVDTFVTIAPGVLAIGGNVLPNQSVYITGTGSAVLSITGLVLGAQYAYVGGNSSSLSQDGLTAWKLPDPTNQVFVATQTTYYFLADISLVGQICTGAMITAGLNQIANLPADFKELQPNRSIFYVTDDGQFIPAEVVYEQQQVYRVWAFGGTPIVTWPPRIYYSRKANSASIGMLEPLTQNFNFKVMYYRYLPDMVEDTDRSPFLDAYPNMVLAKAKEIAFIGINDAESDRALKEYEGKYADAVRQDAYAEVRGRETRM